MTKTAHISRLALVAALGITLASSPVAFTPTSDGWNLGVVKAFAKDGRDDDGDDRDDDRGGDRDDDRDDDRGRDRDDDRDDDDDRGRGRGRDDSSRSRSGDDSSSGIEVRLSDGGRIEIENGRFERKDAFGNTIVERPATAADYAALGRTAPSGSQAASGSAGSNGGSPEQIRVGRVVKAEVLGGNIEVTYSRGWKEEIENGRYELKDPANRTVVQRAATAGDRARLSALAN